MKKKKKNKSTKKLFLKKDLRRAVLGFFREFPNKNLNYKQIYKLLGSNTPKTLIIKLLKKLNKNNKILEVKPGKYKLLENLLKISGIVKSVSSRGLIVIADDDKEVFVGLNYSRFAYIGDKVLLLVFPQKKGRKKGEVLKVLERIKTTFVGTLQYNEKNYSFLILDNKKIPFDVFIPKIKSVKNYKGKKLLVEVTDWSESNKNPVGKIISIIGDLKNHETEIHSILYDYDLPVAFSKNILLESEKIPLTISKNLINNRKDFRDIDSFTIDPEDAKDFDDALSVQKLKSGDFEIGVHIADISCFVEKDSVIDIEAKKRGASVYLVDRVISMLPEILSNEICSLKPNVDRLCFSIVFTMNKYAKVIDFWIGESILHSNKRFTYSEAQKIIDKGEGVFCDQLKTLDRFSKILRKNRQDCGSLIFEKPEIKFVLNEKNEPIDICFNPILNTNHLVEEFMLLANKTVAGLFEKKKNKPFSPFIYRAHDSPNDEKLVVLSRLVEGFGYKLDLSYKKNITESLNKLSSQIKGRKEENMIETLIVRSMAKANYTTNNIGHYGLGFNFYSHFTSPIRRYPDLIAHRLLKQYLNNIFDVNQNDLESVCKHCSEMERRASLAERDSTKYIQAKYMKANIGKIYDGIISGVTNWGLYVELIKNKCEGLVKVKSLSGGFFVFDEKTFTLTNKETKMKYQLGQKVTVTVMGVDLEQKQIDFTLA